MVLPEGAPSTESGNRTRWKLGSVIAALAVTGAAAVVVITVTSPADENPTASPDTTITTEDLAAPTTSTTAATTTTIDIANFTIGAIATGERLSWFRAPTFVSGSPVALVAHQGNVWLFTATTAGGPDWRGRGLNAWVSLDGVDWAPAGVVASEEFSISRVDAVGDLLVAIGSRFSDGTPHVWVSQDGSNWTVSPLPLELEIGATRYRTWQTGMAAVGESLHVIGSIEPDWQAEIVAKLPHEMADHVMYDYGLGYRDLGDGERRIDVYGPMGLLAFTATLGELGIDEETASKVFEGSRTSTSFIWSSSDGTAWSTLKLDGTWLHEIAALPDGRLFVAASDSQGEAILTSRVGDDWKRIDQRMHTRVVGSWTGLLLGVSNDEDLVVSPDGTVWRSLGTGQLLPGPFYWQLDPVAATADGLAVLATTWPSISTNQPPSVTIQEGGSTLEFDPSMGRLIVSAGDLSVTVPLWREGAEDLTEVDFADEEVAFLDPDSGKVVGTFSFEALERVESTAFGPDAGERALLLLERGTEWIILDLAEEIGPQARILMMEYFGDQLVMVTTNSNPWPPSEPMRFSVRVANLP